MNTKNAQCSSKAGDGRGGGAGPTIPITRLQGQGLHSILRGPPVLSSTSCQQSSQRFAISSSPSGPITLSSERPPSRFTFRDIALCPYQCCCNPRTLSVCPYLRGSRVNEVAAWNWSSKICSKDWWNCLTVN
jgi:hypothetical protein